MGPGLVLVGAVALLVMVTIAKGIRIVQQAQTMIVERFLGLERRVTVVSSTTLVGSDS